MYPMSLVFILFIRSKYDRRREPQDYTIGIFDFPKCDVNLQPNTRGIGLMVGRTSRYRRSVMLALAVMSILVFCCL